MRTKPSELLAATAGRRLDTCLDQETKCPLYKDRWKKCPSMSMSQVIKLLLSHWFSYLVVSADLVSFFSWPAGKF